MATLDINYIHSVSTDGHHVTSVSRWRCERGRPEGGGEAVETSSINTLRYMQPQTDVLHWDTQTHRHTDMYKGIY